MSDSLAEALAAARAAVDAELNVQQEKDAEDEAGDMEEDDDEDYDDDDIDAEAQEIARRLGQQLWEDINKAQAAQAASVAPQKQTHKEEVVLETMKTILSLIAQDAAARSTLEFAPLPSTGESVLHILHQCVFANSVAKCLCTPLSHILVSLAKSEALFGGLRHSDVPSLELDKGKRRRDEGEGNIPPSDQRLSKRPYIPQGGLYTQVSEAVRVITQALRHPPQDLDPTLIASIRLQLHQVFLFAVTSSARGGPEMHALQEISGLIQVIGVLSGIQIGQPPETLPNQPPFANNSAYPWNQSHSLSIATDIGTAVYPCLVINCGKTFSRLYSLRAHQRGHSTHRPFRCMICPASFARNHDLKRHVRLHDKKAWKCGGCQKIFSRRDAIKRHKNGNKTRGPKSEICINADVVEVDLDEDGEDLLREERRAKLWSSIAAIGAQSPQRPYCDAGIVEEGELFPATIANTQATVLSLQGLLQSHVGSALGTPQNQPMPTSYDPIHGQATLASVIARAQSQALPAKQASVPDVEGAVAAAVSVPNTVTLTPLTGDGAVNNTANPADQRETPIMPSLSMYGLSDEQAKMLELAIANAASAAQAQAEAEAALEEEEEEEFSEDTDDTDDQGAI